MVGFLKFPMLRRLSLLLVPLGCIAVDDLESSCAPDFLSTEPFLTAEVCPGKSLLQASAHRSTVETQDTAELQKPVHSRHWHTGEKHKFPNAKDLRPTGFRKRLGEFCIGVFCVVVFGCGYIFCCTFIMHEKDPSDEPGDASSAHAERGQVEEGNSPLPGSDKVVRRSSIQQFAFKEESDAGDWVVDASWQIEEPGNYEPECIPKYIEAHFSSWSLLMKILGALVQFWGALAFMYWSLLYSKEELMNCDAYPPTAVYSFFATHACHYTLACLQGFPILAANMILVLMVRTLLQTRFYYSMLQKGYLVVFQSVPVMYTMWPWFIAISMLQGGSHFCLKAYFEPETIHFVMWVMLLRKFILPGSIFFFILFRYADVENTLVPLNHIAELEVTQDQDYSPWLAKMKIMNERVIAFDVRHRDVYTDALADSGRLPGLDDIIQNVIANYETASSVWHTRMHRSWGLFRSMWPAALLLDRRLDWSDKDTRSWLIASAILVLGCIITSLLSVYTCMACTSNDGWHLLAVNIKSIFTTRHFTDTATMLGDFVIVCHAVMVVVLLVNTIYNMFYFSFSKAEVDKAVVNVSTARKHAVTHVSTKSRAVRDKAADHLSKATTSISQFRA